MNCDRIAPWYRLLEYAAFGPALQRCRCHFLPELKHQRKVLMLGEGDGRFLTEFAQSNPSAEIDYADRSATMLKLASERTRQPNTHFHHLNALTDSLPASGYDTIVTHFFLDCLSQEELTVAVQKITAAATRSARWIVSEFREPAEGWKRLRARLWIRGLYLAFRIATKLENQRLPDHAAALRDAGFVLESEHLASAGLLTSQMWLRQS